VSALAIGVATLLVLALGTVATARRVSAQTPGPAAGLAFTVEPSNASTGVSFSVAVSVVDANDNVEVSDSTDQVALAITTGSGASGATLSCGSGGETATVSSGTADFNCSIDTAGVGYTLTATNPGGSLAPIVTSAFDIGQESATVDVSPDPATIINLDAASFNVTVAVAGIGGVPLVGDEVNLGLSGEAGLESFIGPSNPNETDSNGVASFNVVCYYPYCTPGQVVAVTATDVTTNTLLGGSSESVAALTFPTEGLVGESETLTFEDGAVSQPVSIGFSPEGSSTQQPASLSGNCSTDSNGNLANGQCTFTVPDVAGVTLPADVTATVTVGTGSSASSSQITFFLEQTPTIVLSPTSGPAGTVITVNGSDFGYAGTETVTFTPAGSSQSSTSTDCYNNGDGDIINSGSSTCQLTVPTGTNGGTATVAVSGFPSATAPFQVQVPETCAQDPDRAGCTLTGIFFDTSIFNALDGYMASNCPSGCRYLLNVDGTYSDGSSGVLPSDLGLFYQFTPVIPLSALYLDGTVVTRSLLGIDGTAPLYLLAAGPMSSPSFGTVSYDGYTSPTISLMVAPTLTVLITGPPIPGGGNYDSEADGVLVTIQSTSDPGAPPFTCTTANGVDGLLNLGVAAARCSVAVPPGTYSVSIPADWSLSSGSLVYPKFVTTTITLKAGTIESVLIPSASEPSLTIDVTGPPIPGGGKNNSEANGVLATIQSTSAPGAPPFTCTTANGVNGGADASCSLLVPADSYSVSLPADWPGPGVLIFPNQVSKTITLSAGQSKSMTFSSGNEPAVTTFISGPSVPHKGHLNSEANGVLATIQSTSAPGAPPFTCTTANGVDGGADASCSLRVPPGSYTVSIPPQWQSVGGTVYASSTLGSISNLTTGHTDPVHFASGYAP
jgi:hypothetical protein